MTSEEEITSNECNTKEIALLEDFLYQNFKNLEKDYDGVDRVLNKLKLEQETNGTISKED